MILLGSLVGSFVTATFILIFFPNINHQYWCHPRESTCSCVYLCVCAYVCGKRHWGFSSSVTAGGEQQHGLKQTVRCVLPIGTSADATQRVACCGCASTTEAHLLVCIVFLLLTPHVCVSPFLLVSISHSLSLLICISLSVKRSCSCICATCTQFLLSLS